MKDDCIEELANQARGTEMDEWWTTHYLKWFVSKDIKVAPTKLAEYANEFYIIHANKKKHMKWFNDEVYYELIQVTMHPDYIQNTGLLNF